MPWFPLPSVPTLTLATPDALSGAVNAPPPAPSTVNVTVPVGVPEPGVTAATVALNETGCPNTDGSGTDVTTVLVCFCVGVTV
nr:hypothetical protein [Streptomyces bathyalis]